MCKVLKDRREGREVLLVVFCHYMVGGRWFMNMFWGVNTIVKRGGELNDIWGGGWKLIFPQA